MVSIEMGGPTSPRDVVRNILWPRQNFDDPARVKGTALFRITAGIACKGNIAMVPSITAERLSCEWPQIQWSILLPRSCQPMSDAKPAFKPRCALRTAA